MPVHMVYYALFYTHLCTHVYTQAFVEAVVSEPSMPTSAHDAVQHQPITHTHVELAAAIDVKASRDLKPAVLDGSCRVEPEDISVISPMAPASSAEDGSTCDDVRELSQEEKRVRKEKKAERKKLLAVQRTQSRDVQLQQLTEIFAKLDRPTLESHLDHAHGDVERATATLSDLSIDTQRLPHTDRGNTLPPSNVWASGAVRAALRDERVEAERRNSAVTEAIGAGLLDQCVHVASLAPCGRCVTAASILGAVLAGVVQLPADISVAALMSERGDANVREFINAHRRLAADIV